MSRSSTLAAPTSLADAIADRTDAAAWIRREAQAHGLAFAPASIDRFAHDVSRLSDAGVTLDPTEETLLALGRAGIVSDEDSAALHAAYLRQRKA